MVDPPDPLVTTLTTKEPGLGGRRGGRIPERSQRARPSQRIPTVELQTALGEIAYRLGSAGGHAAW